MAQMNRMMGEPLWNTRKISAWGRWMEAKYDVDRYKSASRLYLEHSRRIGGWRHEGVSLTLKGGHHDDLEAMDSA